MNPKLIYRKKQTSSVGRFRKQMQFMVLIILPAIIFSCAGADVRYEQSPMSKSGPAKGKVVWTTNAETDGDLQLAYYQNESSTLPSKKNLKSYDAPQKPQPDQQVAQKQKAPLVVYQGFLQLRVRRTIEAADAITKITEKAGGYIESLSDRAIVVRIPAHDFEAIMDKLASVGKVLDRQVKALDVTAQFTDLQGRLAVAKRTIARLLKLFNQAQKAEDRLRILKEIKRLTEEIENLQSTIHSLKNLVDFFTITVQLEPVMESGADLIHQSPFDWVRNLEPHWTSISDGKNNIKITLPAGFVLFDEDDSYRAQAADTTILRAGYVKNEPRGDNKFWMDAVGYEMSGRDEELVEEASTGKIAFKVFRNHEARPRYYLVGVYTDDELVYVVEVFYPNPKAFERHHKAVIKALESFRTM